MKKLLFVAAIVWLTLNLTKYNVPAIAQTVPTKEVTWLTAKWAGDDKPFKQVRDEIDKAIQDGQKPIDLVEKYQIMAQKQPFDALVVYKFAYAAFCAVGKDKAYYKSGRFALAVYAMSRVPLPYTYEFTRLRFLAETQDSASPSFKALGSRLLKSNPSDDAVKFHYVETLMPGLYPADRRLALHYANELIKKAPKSSKNYALLGFVYDIAFLEKPNTNDASKMIGAYKKYLSLAPEDDNFRDAAERRIRRNEQWLNKHKASI